MQSQKIIDHIVDWLRTYSSNSRTAGFVVGVSGGIDSALTSYLCALTGRPTLLLEMPIHQAAAQVTRAQEHMRMLCERFAHVRQQRVELTATFEAFKATVDTSAAPATVDMALANSRARLRMATLYYHAGLHGYVVAGTGNKVEDFGIGFYTKYGDGGVDVSPIADLMKTEVYALARHLGIIDSILTAAPTDGLFGDSRTDEDQIGASYPELEWAMRWLTQQALHAKDWATYPERSHLTARQIEVLDIYTRRHLANQHKMIPIPVCEIPEGYFLG